MSTIATISCSLSTGMDEFMSRSVVRGREHLQGQVTENLASHSGLGWKCSATCHFRFQTSHSESEANRAKKEGENSVSFLRADLILFNL